jgi:hypothetical protein
MFRLREEDFLVSKARNSPSVVERGVSGKKLWESYVEVMWEFCGGCWKVVGKLFGSCLEVVRELCG